MVESFVDRQADLKSTMCRTDQSEGDVFLQARVDVLHLKEGRQAGDYRGHLWADNGFAKGHGELTQRPRGIADHLSTSRDGE
jgi:hypothetical protein